MPTRPTRAAVFVAAAALLFAPHAARLASAVDEPAKPADAKDAPPAEGRQRAGLAAMLDRVEAALKDLSLSDDQKDKAKALVAKAKDVVGGAGEGGREKFQAAGRALADLKEGLGNVLSDDQKKALAEKVPFLAGGHPGAGAGGGAQRPAVMQRAIEAAIEKVTLSDDQKAKLKAVVSDTQKKVREVVESGKVERDAMAEKIRPLLDAQRDKIAEILSADQLPKFQAAVREQVEKLRGDAGGRPGARGGDRPAGDKPAEEKKADEK